MKPFRGIGVELQQRAPCFVLTTFLVPPFLDDWNSSSRRQFVHCRREIDLFVIHDKPENAPTDTAPKAVECLPLGTDRKRWCLFLVKRTKRLEAYAGTLERKISADHFHDVVRACDLFDRFRRNRHLFTRSDFAAMANLAREQPLQELWKNRPCHAVHGRVRWRRPRPRNRRQG